MGSEQNRSNVAFYMHVQIIGDKFDEKLLEYISRYKNTSFSFAKQEKALEDYWDFSTSFPFEVGVKNYFNKLKEYDDKRKTGVKECLIVKIDNTNSPKIKMIFDEMVELSDSYYMPLILFLTTDENVGEVQVSSEYSEIDPRTIYTYPYPVEIFKKEKFMNILYRFCSILNELGDRFTVGKGDNAQDIDLIENYFPFNINIACIGRFRVGKSTGVNEILNEYKAKESNRGTTQTKQLTFYQVSNKPVRVLDIPGFENEKTVEDAIKKFQLCGEKINKIKDNLHVILYFLSFKENSAFYEFEFPMFLELSKHKNSKLIYVITHSINNKRSQDKFIKNINLRLKDVIIRKRKELKKKTRIFL